MVTYYYRRGYVLETDIMKELEKRGYYVIRSAGSHRLCDLIAIPNKNMLDNKPLCIQCKKTTKPNQLPKISKKELEMLKKLEKEYNVKVLLGLRYRFKGRWITELVTPDEYLAKKAKLKNKKVKN